MSTFKWPEPTHVEPIVWAGPPTLTEDMPLTERMNASRQSMELWEKAFAVAKARGFSAVRHKCLAWPHGYMLQVYLEGTPGQADTRCIFQFQDRESLRPLGVSEEEWQRAIDSL